MYFFILSDLHSGARLYQATYLKVVGSREWG